MVIIEANMLKTEQRLIVRFGMAISPATHSLYSLVPEVADRTRTRDQWRYHPQTPPLF